MGNLSTSERGARGGSKLSRPARLVLVFVITLLLAIPALPALAQSYVTYVVQPGDSLSKIAARYCTSWQTIYDMNRAAIGPDPGTVEPGTVLTVPNNCGGGSTGPVDHGPRTHATGYYQAPYYTVAWGDTLTSIGQRFGTSPQAIMNANGMTSSTIQPGQVLYIPSSGSQPPVPPTPPPPAGAERVSFSANAVSATRVGTISNGQPKMYVLKAMAGQTMEIQTSSHGVPLYVSVATGSGQQVPLTGSNGQVYNQVSGYLPYTTDYYVTVTPVMPPEGPQMAFDIVFYIW